MQGKPKGRGRTLANERRDFRKGYTCRHKTRGTPQTVQLAKVDVVKVATGFRATKEALKDLPTFKYAPN